MIYRAQVDLLDLLYPWRGELDRHRVGKAKFERLAECGKVRASQN